MNFITVSSTSSYLIKQDHSHSAKSCCGVETTFPEENPSFGNDTWQQSECKVVVGVAVQQNLAVKVRISGFLPL